MSTPPGARLSPPEVALWLTLQRAYAFRPQDVAERLRDGASPQALLAASSARPSAAELRLLERLGAEILPLPSEGYPLRLRRLVDAPPVLSLVGSAELLTERCVAIVGARAATRYGLRVARMLGRELAGAGLVVVSGLARGIDAEAHRGALEAGGATIAVQACGIDNVYPASHRDLAGRIDSEGARITEFPLGTPALKHHFPLRNRLISGLAEAVIVVEARLRSGTLVTARLAGDQGVDVFAVPGPIDAEIHRGALQLLREGAGIVVEPSDVLGALRPPVEALERAGCAEPAKPAGRVERVAAGNRLSDAADRVLERLAAGPLHRDALARALGIGPGDLALPLLELELAGRIEEERDGRTRRID